LDAECAATVRRILSGVDFSADAFTLDIIKELGSAGCPKTPFSSYYG